MGKWVEHLALIEKIVNVYIILIEITQDKSPLVLVTGYLSMNLWSRFN
jgi:hypothetical protein